MDEYVGHIIRGSVAYHHMRVEIYFGLKTKMQVHALLRSYCAINRSMLRTSCAAKKNSSRQNKGELRISANEAIPQYDTPDLRDKKSPPSIRVYRIPLPSICFIDIHTVVSQHTPIGHPDRQLPCRCPIRRALSWRRERDLNPRSPF